MNDDELPPQPRGLPAGAFRLDGKVAVVTGASKNIGLEIVAALAQAGADVLMVARDRVRLDDAAARIRAQSRGRRIETVAADVSVKADADRIVDTALESFEHVAVLVNNAHTLGGARGVPILDVEDSSWEACFATNLLGPFRLIRGLVKPMVESGRGGSIVNTLSGSGFQPTPFNGPYGTTKASLWMLTRYLAQECAPLVRANAICPGIVTENRRPRSKNGQEMLESGAIPMRRIGGPEEVAPAVVYLSSRAASYVTGEVIFVNGGRAW
jgi:NAD(P)-dependent dehydrogenase (short-subunit alcohol dehydrogenase family)